MTRYPGFRQYMEHERGFHGWLVYFFITSCIGAAFRTYWLFRVGGALRLTTETGSAGLIALAATEAVLQAALLGATVYGLYLFASADPRTPTLWGAFLLVSMLSFIVFDAIAALQSRMLGAPTFSATFWPMLRGELRGMALQLVWALYWMRSARVRLTFGSNAFARRPPLPTSSLAPVT